MGKKYTVPEDVILRLRTALEQSDRKLELILAEPPPRRDEWAATVCLGVRRVIRAGLKDCGWPIEEETNQP